jgi:hypothetical protein
VHCQWQAPNAVKITSDFAIRKNFRGKGVCGKVFSESMMARPVSDLLHIFLTWLLPGISVFRPNFGLVMDY